MEKHERKQREKLLARCKVRCNLGDRVASGDKAIDIDKAI